MNKLGGGAQLPVYSQNTLFVFILGNDHLIEFHLTESVDQIFRSNAQKVVT